MRCAGPIRREQSRPEAAVCVGISCTLRMPTSPVERCLSSQALIVVTFAQKSRAGGFPPPLLVLFSQEKTLGQTQAVAGKSICNILASQGGQ